MEGSDGHDELFICFGGLGWGVYEAVSVELSYFEVALEEEVPGVTPVGEVATQGLAVFIKV